MTISYMMDLSRNGVPNKEFLKKFIVLLQKMGYNELQLYMEDTFVVEGEPYFGYFRGPLTKEFIQEMDGFAKEHGIRLVPAIETLGHMVKLFRWYRYYPIHDINDALLEGEEKTYELLDKMFASLREAFSTDVINIGMDETYACGRGAHIDRFGFEEHRDIFLRHLGRVTEIAKKHGFSPMMWGDMFLANDNHGHYFSQNPTLSEKTIRLKPESVTPIYWDYYNTDPKMIKGIVKAFYKLDKNFIYAGGNWSWRGFAPRNDTSLLVHKTILPIVKAYGCDYFINTSWGDDGNECLELATLPGTFAFAELAKGNKNVKDIKAKFLALFGIPYDAYASLDDLNNLGTDRKLDLLIKKNPAKYMLYSDPLSSPFDATVTLGKEVVFAKAARKYKRYINHEEYGYVFRLAYHLAKVLELKYPLGIKNRQAYRNGDKEALKESIKTLGKLEKRITAFLASVKEGWLIENSSFGLEVLSMRLGGLLQRTKDAKETISAYLEGKIDHIDELEAELVPYNESPFGMEVVEQRHLNIVTTSYTSFQN